MWIPYDNEKTIGTVGSESGKIIKDEEHDKGSRITLEQDCESSSFSITCGIYGFMVHFSWACPYAECNCNIRFVIPERTDTWSTPDTCLDTHVKETDAIIEMTNDPKAKALGSFIITKRAEDYGITLHQTKIPVVRIPAAAFLYLLGSSEKEGYTAKM